MFSREISYQSNNDLTQFEEIDNLFLNDNGCASEKLDHFTKYVNRQSLSKFITKYEIFKKVLNVNGSVIECGVFRGGDY